jgi:hypothetical protein
MTESNEQLLERIISVENGLNAVIRDLNAFAEGLQGQRNSDVQRIDGALSTIFANMNGVMEQLSRLQVEIGNLQRQAGDLQGITSVLASLDERLRRLGG